MARGLARTLFSKGKGKYGKGPMYTVMEEEEDWNQWSGNVEQEGEGAPALFKLTDGLAGRRSTTFPPSGQWTFVISSSRRRCSLPSPRHDVVADPSSEDQQAGKQAP